jgi:putative membrane protein
MNAIVSNDKLYFRIILAISIAIPVVVGILLMIPGKENLAGSFDVTLLPKLNAIINSTVSVLLVAGYIAIRNKKQSTHKSLMLTAFFLSGLFLISYVTYHYLAVESKFGDVNHDGSVTEAELAAAGSLRYVYYFILLTHILLSTAIVPMVLVTIYRSFSGQLEKHKKLARWTFPLWLYVSVTGVVVYLLIAPYYPV